MEAARELLTVPTAGYDRPFFIGQGLSDIDVPAPLTLKFAADLAANGVDFAFHTYPTDHLGTVPGFGSRQHSLCRGVVLWSTTLYPEASADQGFSDDPHSAKVDVDRDPKLPNGFAGVRVPAT